ncbi:sulfotransferase family protein [Alteromonas oceanisediminis]|uniref:sulfotransferase family protein n=1 Tax=Alteromonas oceanisediminis TaxID=2836180 RepID=UPI001BD932DA|nr:sulfotransferase [Alteromonas oceanisediminis]MBT0585055.1 sulfotransferase [Alteromonas oceanisediminis]
MANQLCIVFVCQAGELELKGLLLAASIRRYSRLKNIDLVAAVPDPVTWGHLADETSEMLNSLSVRQVTIDCPFGRDYPIGNKISAIGVETQAPVTVFMDSDILCLGPLSEFDLLTSNLKAKPADLNTYTGGYNQWQQAYRLINADVPSLRVLSTVSNEVMVPYFNAGLIAVRNGKSFARAWLAAAIQIDQCDIIQYKRPWLDQIALPVAATSLGYSFEILTEEFNFPAHLKRLNQNYLPTLCHYHSPDIISQEPVLSRLVANLCEMHPFLLTLIQKYQFWKSVIKRSEVEKPVRKSFLSRIQLPFSGFHADKKTSPRDFLITGLPRSGTSLLCNLLHKAPDVVVVNEPTEVFSALEKDPTCLPLDRLYRSLRTDIVIGNGIKNKVSASGNVIEDTRINDGRRHYQPHFQSTDFRLGTKNPLAYLSRLRVLCDALPEMPIIVMVRHPLDVIASWKASFSHLNNVDFNIIPFADETDPLLDPVQIRLLHAIRHEPYLPVKRVLYFNYLAEMIRRDKERVLVVRYEDLVGRPKSTMLSVTQHIGIPRLSWSILSTVRSSHSKKILDGQDEAAVTTLCGDFMNDWGYEV